MRVNAGVERRRLGNRPLRAMAVAFGVLGVLVGPAEGGHAAAAAPERAYVGPPGLRGLDVVHRVLEDAAGQPITLLGVNHAGTEYACAQGWGIFDGPSGRPLVAAMASWGIDVVRVPLNEDCWLGVNVRAAFAGAAYRTAIEGYVRELSAAGVAAILDLHWSAPGAQPALGQEQMPDASHAIAFWRSVARDFRTDRDALFELYNEPRGVSWRCWRAGCVTSQGWRAVGMQRLVSVVRAAGADQPIIVDGLNWANDLTGWLAAGLRDPRHQLIAGFHVYPWNACVDAACWSRTVAPLAERVPVIATEVGESDCTGRFVGRFLSWATAHDVSSLVWTWNDNEGCQSLLADPTGVPSGYGSAVRADLLGLEWRAVKGVGRKR